MTTPPPRQVQHPCLPQGLSGSSKLLGCFWSESSEIWPVITTLYQRNRIWSLCVTQLSPPPCVSLGPAHVKTWPAENGRPGLESTSPSVMLISARHISTEHLLWAGHCSGLWGHTDLVLRQTSFGFWLCHLPAMWSWATDRPLWASGSSWVQQWGFHGIRHLKCLA